jgi:uncharacterized protein YndB with AHSA1/START domain
MEYGSIEREIQVEATPDVVYEVISQPEHLRAWWPDEAELTPVPGATGVISFGDRSTPQAKVVPPTRPGGSPSGGFMTRTSPRRRPTRSS